MLIQTLLWMYLRYSVPANLRRNRCSHNFWRFFNSCRFFPWKMVTLPYLKLLLIKFANNFFYILYVIFILRGGCIKHSLSKFFSALWTLEKKYFNFFYGSHFCCSKVWKKCKTILSQFYKIWDKLDFWNFI